MTVTLAAFFLAIAVSLLWAGLDLLRKVLVARVSPLALLFLLSLGVAPFFVVWGWSEGTLRWQPDYFLPAGLSIVLNVAANLAFFEAVRISPLSLTIPLLSFTPVFATLLAIPLLGEVPNAWQAAGIAMVVVGAYVLGSPAHPLRGKRRSLLRDRGSLLMLFVALVWAATIALDKMSIERSSEALHGAVLSTGVGSAALVLLVGRGRLGDVTAVRVVPGAAVAALVVSGLALGLQLVLLEHMWVGMVETLKRGIGNALAIVSGRLFFGEEITVAKVSSVFLMALGVAALFA